MIIHSFPNTPQLLYPDGWTYANYRPVIFPVKSKNSNDDGSDESSDLWEDSSDSSDDSSDSSDDSPDSDDVDEKDPVRYGQQAYCFAFGNNNIILWLPLTHY